jgi:threonine/homoserine/homoserine lactone efflux protein
VPDPSTLALFSAAALALIVVPGPAVLYIVAQGIDRGRVAGVVSALGISAGGLVHVLAAAVGLSAVIVSSATAFTVVKYAGAAYLVVLGLRRLLSRGEERPTAAAAPQRTVRRTVWQGVVVNVLNPKTALFFLAFLPQFVDADRGHVVLQVAVLGLVFVALALLSDSAWGLAAGSAAGWLRARPGVLRAQRWTSGGVMVGLGVAAALTGERRN